jgi:predicted RNase H-like nuclease
MKKVLLGSIFATSLLYSTTFQININNDTLEVATDLYLNDMYNLNSSSNYYAGLSYLTTEREEGETSQKLTTASFKILNPFTDNNGLSFGLGIKAIDTKENSKKFQAMPLSFYGKWELNEVLYFDLELYRFAKTLFGYLMDKDNSLRYFSYSIQGKDFILEDILEHKANYGTYKYIIKSYQIKDAINRYIDNKQVKFFIFQELISYINTMQDVRNESVHGGSTSKTNCDKIRKNVMAIGKAGMLSELIRMKKYFQYRNMKYIGIDLAWSSKNNSGVAIIENNQVEYCDILPSLDDVINFISQHPDAIVGVDAPLVVENETGNRDIEIEFLKDFAKYKLGVYPVNKKLLEFDGKITGIELRENISQKLGSTLFEVYPHATILRCFHGKVLPYKRKKGRDTAFIKEQLNILQNYLQNSLQGEFLTNISKLKGKSLKEHEDKLDAIVCAYTLYYCHKHRCKKYKDILVVPDENI